MSVDIEALGANLWVSDGSIAPSAMNLEQVNAGVRDTTPEEMFDVAATIDPYLLTSFGLQSAVLIARMRRSGHNFPVLFIDSGVEHDETLEYMDTLKSRFELDVTVVGPHPAVLDQAMDRVTRDGYTAYEKEFNRLTKVEPLKQFIGEAGLQGLVTGIRAVQTANRATKQLIEHGKSGEVRINPHLYVTDEEVAQLYREWKLPQHPLKDEVLGNRLPNRIDPNPSKSECGLHL